jgi:predicted phosphohydrolase
MLFLLLGITQSPRHAGAGERVRQEAATLAAGQPILADGLDAEQFALDGQRVWMANPLDAFSRRDQRLYLDWLAANPSGDALLRRGSPVVVVTRGSPPQQRLARDRSFRRVALDQRAAVYVRVSSG